MIKRDQTGVSYRESVKHEIPCTSMSLSQSSHQALFFFLMLRRPPRSTLFPYTTSSDLLCKSRVAASRDSGRSWIGQTRMDADRGLRRSMGVPGEGARHGPAGEFPIAAVQIPAHASTRSEEHTSELQSLAYLVCRLLLEK